MNGTKITAEAKTLMEQASMTASLYLSEAIERIDKQLGKGYAKDHPELIGCFIKACAQDFNTSMNVQAIQNATEQICERLDDIAANLQE